MYNGGCHCFSNNAWNDKNAIRQPYASDRDQTSNREGANEQFWNVDVPNLQPNDRELSYTSGNTANGMLVFIGVTWKLMTVSARKSMC